VGARHRYGRLISVQVLSWFLLPRRLPFAGGSAITRPPAARLKGCRGGGVLKQHAHDEQSAQIKP